MAYYKSVADMIGNTQWWIRKLENNHGLCARIIAKAEGLNPGGSIKDRAALGHD